MRARYSGILCKTVLQSNAHAKVQKQLPIAGITTLIKLPVPSTDEQQGRKSAAGSEQAQTRSDLRLASSCLAGTPLFGK
jgi:hypothetical protein